MTSTYTPVATPKDEVRLLIGDTDSTDWQFADEEIVYFLGQDQNVLITAVRAAVALSAKYARLADKRIGDEAVSAGQKSQHYKDLIVELKERAEGEGTAIPVNVYAGGISYVDKDGRYANPDRNTASTRMGQFDYPGTSPEDSWNIWGPPPR